MKSEQHIIVSKSKTQQSYFSIELIQTLNFKLFPKLFYSNKIKDLNNKIKIVFVIIMMRIMRWDFPKGESSDDNKTRMTRQEMKNEKRKFIQI